MGEWGAAETIFNIKQGVKRMILIIHICSTASKAFDEDRDKKKKTQKSTI